MNESKSNLTVYFENPFWVGVFERIKGGKLSVCKVTFGAAQAATGYAAWVFEKQEAFHVDLSDYPNIGTDKKRLVVFFSRMGYVRKIAYEEANRSGAEVYEVKSTERTDGTLGFWWCGRYGMHKWEMPIEPVPVKLSDYNHVTICTPIWAFSLAAPMRCFCTQATGKVKEADYILVHHQGSACKNAADEMDCLLGLKHTGFRSVRCRKGRYKVVYNDTAKEREHKYA